MLDIDTLNEKQKNALADLKSKFEGDSESYLKSDRYLLHWLIARKFNVDHAEIMLRNHLMYRRTLKMDAPEYKNCGIHPVSTKYYTNGQCGFDKLGHPVFYHPYGGIDPRGIISSVKYSKVYRDHLYVTEMRDRLCAEQSKKLGKIVDQSILIVDLHGVGTKHLYKPGLDMVTHISWIAEENSPESVYKIFIVNAPLLFNVIWTLVLPILSKHTREKTQLFGETGWQDILLSHIDASQLPVKYGGSMVDSFGNEDCSEWIHYGGEVPREFYFENHSDVLPAGAELIEMTVKRGQVIDIPIRIENAPSTLFWYFALANYDIGFSILYKPFYEPETADGEFIVPYFRLITVVIPEFGDIVVDQPGQYILRFDNSYSWIHSKDVKYYVSVTAATATDIA